VANGVRIRPGRADEAVTVFDRAGMREAAQAAGDGLADDENCWVAESGDATVGVVLGRLANEILDDDDWTKAALVSYLGVVPDHRGEGVGSRLLGVFVAEATRAGASFVTLLVPPSADARLRRFYVGNGFGQVDGQVFRLQIR
jgi:GNAT superfamily N-acetyltransferase